MSARSTTTLAALADRVERIGGALAALSRRVDEYATTVSEHVTTRIDELSGEVSALTELTRVTAEAARASEGSPKAINAVELQAALDRLGEALRTQHQTAGRDVLDAVLALHDDAYNELTSLQEAIGSVRQSIDSAVFVEEPGDDDATAQPLAEIRSHLAKLDEVPSQLSSLEQLTAALGSVGDLSELRETLGSVHGELVGLRRSLALLSRNGLALGDEQVDALAEAVAARLADRPTLLRPEQVSILAEAVVARLEQSFEVVDDEGSHAS